MNIPQILFECFVKKPIRWFMNVMFWALIVICIFILLSALIAFIYILVQAMVTILAATAVLIIPPAFIIGKKRWDEIAEILGKSA